MFGSHARVPLRPFAGTIGVAPAEPGHHSVIPPRAVGGNMDIRDLTAGAVLHLPVAVPGALFSIGDTHAAQGDGEVCGTAIESAMNGDRHPRSRQGRRRSRMPRFTIPGPVTRHVDQAGYEVTTGIGPDLMAAARDAVAGMIDLHHGAHRHAAGRGLHALVGRRRPAHQRGRRPAQLGGFLLFSAERPRLIGAEIAAERFIGRPFPLSMPKTAPDAAA